MSIIFGVAAVLGQPVQRQDLLNFAEATMKYAPDGTFVCASNTVGMGFQPYHTQQRSKLEVLPLVNYYGNILSFDGRLDNYAELCVRLNLAEEKTSDSHIVHEAFVRWGEQCFSQLVGDWALALWANQERALYLARDHAGSRSLYFEHFSGRVLWSTYLETFFANGRTTEPDEDFAALYCSCQPTGELTPYKGIKAVPPAHYLRIHDNVVTSNAHWDPVMKRSIFYCDDVQYEEHFLQLFRQSVERRIGPGAPILAHLSGGMDSTSIVCMSDYIRGSQNRSMELLDTVSYYDDSEPDWNEFPFFTAVERSRKKSGIHLNASYSEKTIEALSCANSPQLWPGIDKSAAELDGRLHDALRGRDIRCILSGLGGDEVLGGVPDPLPELADLMVSGDLHALSRRTLEWSLANRTPFLLMFIRTLRFTSDLYFTGHTPTEIVPPWIKHRFVRTTVVNTGTRTPADRRGCFVPSKIDNGSAWLSIMQTLTTRLLSNEERFEYRYPYLDRNLVEFLFSIPRRQLVEPGRRRALMRRALKHIVPSEILERRRKAYLIRGPINLIYRNRDWIINQFRNLRCAELGFIDPVGLPAALDSVAVAGDPKWWPYLMRIINFELWLRSAPLSIPPTGAVRLANKIRVR